MKIKDIYNIFANHSEAQWIMQPYNAQLLYKFVKEHNIKKVLDLGTGIGASAAIIALALKDKGEKDFHIDTVEHLDKCINLAKKLIPDELKENITFHKSEVDIIQFEKIPYQHFSVYSDIPEGDYDLIINDGPPPVFMGECWVDLPNGTIMRMLLDGKIKPGAFVAFDGRLHMLKFLERYYSDNFYLARPAQKGDDLNILERKDNPPHFNDAKLEAMRQSSYFKDYENTNSSNIKTPSGTSEASHQ